MRANTLSGRACGCLAAILLFNIAAVGQESRPSSPATDELRHLVAELQVDVARLRGCEFKKPVPIGFYTEDELQKFVSTSPDDPRHGPQHKARSLAALRMVGLLADDCDPDAVFAGVMTGFVPGVYNQQDKTIYLVPRAGMDFNALHVRSVIVHELVHALDDQRIGLDKLSQTAPDTSEAEHIVGALIEGSAIIVQQLYEAQARATGRYDLAQYQEDVQKEMAGMHALFAAPAYVTLFMARFPAGVQFLGRGDMSVLMKAKDAREFDAALQTAAAALPRSTEQLLHPEKYWQPECRDEPVVVNDADVEKLLGGIGWHVLRRDTLGELLCAVLTSDDRTIHPMLMAMPGYWTNAGAAGWGGDRLYLLARETLGEADALPKSMAALWITAWDTESDRDEFIEEYQDHRAPAGMVVQKLGPRAVAFLYRFDEDARAAVWRQLQAHPPRFTCDGQPWPAVGAAARSEVRHMANGDGKSDSGVDSSLRSE